MSVIIASVVKSLRAQLCNLIEKQPTLILSVYHIPGTTLRDLAWIIDFISTIISFTLQNPTLSVFCLSFEEYAMPNAVWSRLGIQ